MEYTFGSGAKALAARVTLMLPCSFSWRGCWIIYLSRVRSCSSMLAFSQEAPRAVLRFVVGECWTFRVALLK